MQFAKDSFYMTLRQRLAALNPARTVTLQGSMRPAVITAENELVIPIQPLADAFYIEWGAARPVEKQGGSRELMQMDCVISYHTFGTVESGVDRGRMLGQLDSELMWMCIPRQTPKRDYTQTPTVDLGTNIFWNTPQLGEISGSQGSLPQGLPRGTQRARLERRASLSLFFFPEVDIL
ncbi:MAG TPA: hypothetical protein VFA68_07575 [Terriglobales bacterium]|nr:hypothetical protein [Terriglobales bacterium]